jgi:hypothetical protein
MLEVGTQAPDFELYATPDQKVKLSHGIIRWNYLSPFEINPGVDGILDALDEMNKK